MKLLNYFVLTTFILVAAHAVEDYSDWKDGEGLSEDDKKLIKKEFAALAKHGKVIPKVKKILKAMVEYQGRTVKYLVAYEADELVCAGKLERKFNSEHCTMASARAICTDNTPWSRR